MAPSTSARGSRFHAAEEMLVVLDGEMTIKAEDGERLWLVYDVPKDG